MKNTFHPLLPVIIGIPAVFWFAHEVSWKAMLALFIIMFANNISQTIVREQEEEERSAPPKTEGE